MQPFLYSEKSNCRNCYKCIRHCPVKSIGFSGDQATVLEGDCILCGRCLSICPQNAKQFHNSLDDAKALVAGNRVIASIAPSFYAYFKGFGIEALKKALQALGFQDVQETALGATIVKKTYERMVAEKKQSVIISSCCPAVNVLIQRYYPEALGYLAKAVTPMEAHAIQIKQQNPSVKTIFIGPCIAKKQEAREVAYDVDCVLTFSELERWMNESGITLENREEMELPESKARRFPVPGGILGTMDCENSGYTFISVDGVENCMRTLHHIAEGQIERCFIEMSACSGSCSGGPVMAQEHNPVENYLAVVRKAGPKDFVIKDIGQERAFREYPLIKPHTQIPGAKELKRILQKMGKKEEADELNCGSCGYNTCREKAAAIYQGKANYTMCLPFLKEKAESFSENIITHTPYGIVVLDASLLIQQINHAACAILDIASTQAALHNPIGTLMDMSVFLEASKKNANVHEAAVYLEELDKHIKLSVIRDQGYHILIGIMRDVTEEVKTRVKKDRIIRETVNTADQVVEKQMRLVQEIASLLGESTAETKVALTRLKESLKDA